jgi:hypothetical protein
MTISSEMDFHQKKIGQRKISCYLNFPETEHKIEPIIHYFEI